MGVFPVLPIGLPNRQCRSCQSGSLWAAGLNMLSRMRPGAVCMLLAVLVWSIAAGSQQAVAAEPFRAFVDGLKAQGYYDEAYEYLEFSRTSPLIEASQKESLSYEQGLTLIDQALVPRYSTQRETLIERAEAKFQEFLKAHPEHALAHAAHSQLGRVQVERANVLLTKAAASRNADEKQALNNQARQHLNAADKTFTTTIEQLRNLLAGYGRVPSSDREGTELRNQLRGDLYTAEISALTTAYEAAKTYPAGSPEYAAALKQVAPRFAQLHKERDGLMVGLYAQWYEGRCLQDLGNHKQAIDLFFGLFRQIGSTPELRELRAKVARSGLESWTALKLWNDAIHEVGDFASNPQSREAAHPDWLALQYLMAYVYEQAAEGEKAAPKKREYQKLARNLAVAAAREPGEFQSQARELLARTGNTNDQTADGTPKTFAAAFDLGKTALDRREQSSKQIAHTDNKQEQAKYQQDVAQQREAAIRNFTYALQLADQNTGEDRLNQVRYFLSFLYFDGGRHWEAAVVGEYLARKFPKHDSAQAAAMITLAAYQNLYQQATDKTFEAQQIGSISEHIVETWPNTDSADRALNLLLLIAIQQNDFAKAESFISKLSSNSPRRGEAEVNIGQALWSRYLNESKLPEDERPSTENLNATIRQAESYLQQGIESLSKLDDPPASLAFALLSLAQLYVDTTEPQKALEVLERPKVGPITLIKAKNPVIQRDGFVTAAYLAAVRAYVAATPPKFDEAKAALAELRKAAGNNPLEQQRLNSRLMAMGQSIQTQLDELRRSGKSDQADNIAQGFAAFLDSIIANDSSFEVFNWAASSYTGLAAGLSGGDGSTAAQAERYFSQAVKAYEEALAKAPNDDVAHAVRIRIAESYRKTQKFDEAIQAISGVLQARPNLLSAQIAAAEILQEQGRVQRNSAAYQRAIAGDRAKSVWGWARVAAMTAQAPQFRDQYHQARLAIAQTRFAMAQLKNNDPALLQQARNDVSATYILFPDLGGETWSPKYEELLKKIQTALKAPAIGLQEFKKS